MFLTKTQLSVLLRLFGGLYIRWVNSHICVSSTERVGECFLTSNHQLFSYIMVRTGYIQ